MHNVILIRLLLVLISLFGVCLEAKLPDLTPQITHDKIEEILKAHATYKALTPELVQRILINYIDLLDPTKTYFIETDIAQWDHASSADLNKILTQMNAADYSVFFQIVDAMQKAIERRHELQKNLNFNDLPKNVKSEEFKDMKWAASTKELTSRLLRIRALQVETASKLNEELKERSLQRIDKHIAKNEEEILTTDPQTREKFILSNVLKATAMSLDTHTSYFTPDEATQFMINVQQRLFGIGAQLRDDINGFSVIKIIEGGPAAEGKALKIKDRIIAVNGEPVVGMDIIDAVDLIRGEQNTPVTLTVIRKTTADDGRVQDEKLDIVIHRGEVVLKESRFEVNDEPFGESSIGYMKLFSFYQDPESSSSADLSREIVKLKKEHNLRGLILDLRSNAGGMLSQAVEVTGLFITKGVVVSIKDENGVIQHLRDIDGSAVWTGPLIVLINRSSASASEIVAQTLQDYGRALIVGDDHSFGKGSFQTFTLNSTKAGSVNPQGEYKVTRGRYYTVSGKTPQLTGVASDIVVPGPLSESEVGEKFAKYPLESDHIPDNFDDDLSDVSPAQREKIKQLYKFNLQPKLHTYEPYLELLKVNSSTRIAQNKSYQQFLKDLKNKDKDNDADEESAHQAQNGHDDLQLMEALNIMKDLIYLMDVGHSETIGPKSIQ